MSYRETGNSEQKSLNTKGKMLVARLVDMSMTRRLISRNVGVPAGFDNRKSREKPGIAYRSLEGTLKEVFQQLVAANALKS